MEEEIKAPLGLVLYLFIRPDNNNIILYFKEVTVGLLTKKGQI